jgi:hypothetical protein
LGHASIWPLIAGHAFDASRLNAETIRKSLQPRIVGISDNQRLARDCALVSNVFSAVSFLSEHWVGSFGLDIVVRLFRHFEVGQDGRVGGIFFFTGKAVSGPSVQNRQQDSETEGVWVFSLLM